MARMRRIQVLLEPELDDRLEREAAARRISKSALVRELVSVELSRPIVGNGLLALAGMGEGGEPDDSVNHDEIIYEWRNE
jgi:hypothetical protein